jgi:hypothetical protein
MSYNHTPQIGATCARQNSNDYPGEVDVDPKIKSAFEQAADGFDEAERKKRTAAQEHVDARNRFQLAWRDKCLNMVLPVLGQIRDALAAKGWDCNVTNDFQKEMSATIIMHKGNKMTVTGGSKLPYVAFVADKVESTINVLAGSISQSGGAATLIPLEQVTEQFVQEQVLKVFQRIASGA